MGEDCYKLPVPKQISDYLSFQSLEAPIAYFYNPNIATPTDVDSKTQNNRNKEIFDSVMRKYDIEVEKRDDYWDSADA